MNVAQYFISKFTGIGYGFLMATIFCFIPIGVIIAGYFNYKRNKRANLSTAYIVAITAIAELVSLIPLFGTIFFAEDGVLYLFFIPIAVLTSIVFLVPFILPVLYFVVTKKRKERKEPIFFQTICFSLLEVLFLVATVLLLLNDYSN